MSVFWCVSLYIINFLQASTAHTFSMILINDDKTKYIITIGCPKKRKVVPISMLIKPIEPSCDRKI